MYDYDNEVMPEIVGYVFENSVELTKLIAEKDTSISSKQQILEAYENAFETVVKKLEQMSEDDHD